MNRRTVSAAMRRDALQPLPNMIEQALDYWDSKRAGRHMPARRDIDPTEMSHLLPHVVLIDVQREPLDFRYRLMGTAVAARLGSDYTGERFSALPHQAHGTPVWKTAVRILEEKRPIVSHIAYVGTTRWVSNYRDLSMPLSEDDRTVNMIFGILQFENG
jgi:hypothetical protein